MKTLMLDMDGVIVDFVKGALKFHGREDYVVKHWDFDQDICETREDFWKDLGFSFWANLPWTPQGIDFLGYLRKEVGKENICFLTSPCATVGSIEGKIEWLRRKIPDMSRQFAVSPMKQAFAHHKALLVDDSDVNCAKFKLGGGNSIVVPQLWNHRSEEKFDPRMLALEVSTQWAIL
jgi:5'(3')-deoxyribonucleotidase